MLHFGFRNASQEYLGICSKKSKPICFHVHSTCDLTKDIVNTMHFINIFFNVHGISKKLHLI